MAWSKPPQALIELFSESLPDDPGVEPRKVFGLPSAFVNGVMFAGVFQDSVFARLPPDLWATLEREMGACQSRMRLRERKSLRRIRRA